MKILNQIIFQLNTPTRNGNVYDKDSFLNLDGSFKLSQSLPPKNSSIARCLTIPENDEVGLVENVKIEDNIITADITLYRSQFLTSLESFSIRPISTCKLTPKEDNFFNKRF